MNDRPLPGRDSRPVPPSAFAFSSEPPTAGGGYAAPPPPPPAGPPPGDEPPAAGPGLPWEERSQLGFGAAIMQSVQMFLGAPRDAFDRARRKGDYGSPVLWVLIFGFLSALIQWFWSLALAGPMTAFMSAMMPESVRGPFAAQMAATVGLTGLFNVIWVPLVALIASFIGAAIFHLALMVAGGSRDSDSGFEGTFRAYGYSSVAQLAVIVPFLGGLIALVWSIVLLVVGMSSMHRISTGKAVVVVLIPLFVCCACISIALALGAASMFGLARHTG